MSYVPRLIIHRASIFHGLSPDRQQHQPKPNIMAFDTVNMEEITEARRKAITESIRTISVEEMKALGEQLFPLRRSSLAGKVLRLSSPRTPAPRFHHATTHDHVQIIYCPAKDKGMWFMPGTGMGPMQPKGLGILKAIVEGR